MKTMNTELPINLVIVNAKWVLMCSEFHLLS